MQVPIIGVRNPWFDFLVNGQKKVEGRKASDKGLAILDWFNKTEFKFLILDNENGRHDIFKVTDIRRYSSKKPCEPNLNEDELKKFVMEESAVRVYLEQEGLRWALPGIKNLEDGINVYRQWSNDKELANTDFLAIEMSWLVKL